MATSRDLKAAIATNRFGLGARPGEIDAAKSDPEGYLLAQIQTGGADQPQPNGMPSWERINQFRVFQRDRRQNRNQQAAAGASPPPRPGRRGDADGPVPPERDPVQIAGRMIRLGPAVDFLARFQMGARTGASFRERWALFWANHFTVSGVKLVTAVVVGPYEQEAIRPHVFDTFENLLVAATVHPAMLLYLDQAQSTGPNSLGAAYVRRQQGGGGLNENLAREILELHTVGINGGYAQADVTEFARALTGWSVGGPNEAGDRQGKFIYRPIIHEPGARTVMGKSYPNTGGQQALAVLKDLAASPATARHLATKIARHFVSEDPPASLVARLEQSYLRTGGRLDELARTLVTAPEAWEPTPQKFKNPYDFLISAWRTSGSQPNNIQNLAPILTAMGQKPFSAPSPKGWPEENANWAAPDAIIKRLAYAEGFANAAAAYMEPTATAQAALGASLSDPTATAIRRAETRAEGLAILLMSPEFQRR
ncbi:MAG: DUF1800 family protein [Caulobacteraceae bacterium]